MDNSNDCKEKEEIVLIKHWNFKRKAMLEVFIASDLERPDLLWLSSTAHGYTGSVMAEKPWQEVY